MLSGGAGLIAAAWAIRFPGPIFAGYVLIGWASQVVVRQWDPTDLRIECLLVATSCLILTLGTLWLDDLWSPVLLALAGLRAALTCGTVPLVHHLAVRGLKKAQG